MKLLMKPLHLQTKATQHEAAKDFSSHPEIPERVNTFETLAGGI
jgi:hypothetical protein